MKTNYKSNYLVLKGYVIFLNIVDYISIKELEKKTKLICSEAHTRKIIIQMQEGELLYKETLRKNVLLILTAKGIKLQNKIREFEKEIDIMELINK